MNAFKKCGCGRAFTKEQWERLPAIGHQITDDEEGQYDLEMKNCSCGSTLGVERKTHNAKGQPLDGAEIGTSWESPAGTRVVVQSVAMPDGSVRLGVRTAGANQMDLIRPGEIDAEIRRDAANLKFHTDQKARVNAEEAVVSARRKKLDAFLVSFAPLARGKANAALTKSVMWAGEGAPRYEQIEGRFAKGWRVKVAEKGERRFEAADGRFFSEKDTTKVGMDYAEALNSGRLGGLSRSAARQWMRVPGER